MLSWSWVVAGLATPQHRGPPRLNVNKWLVGDVVLMVLPHRVVLQFKTIQEQDPRFSPWTTPKGDSEVQGYISSNGKIQGLEELDKSKMREI